MSYLGIDIGTTGAKSVVFDHRGRMLSSDYGEYPLICPGNGCFELDAGEVIKTCKKVIASSADRVKSTDPVRAIGISSQGEAFTLLDKKGQYLCNAMVSFDTRSKDQVVDFIKAFGAERLYRITGHSPHTIFSLFKVLWIKQNKPLIFDKINRFLCMADLLGYELSGQSKISYNLAARTMMFDIKSCKWSEDILSLVGLDQKVFSEPVAAGFSIGTIRKDLAEQLSLEKDTIVATGGHDQSCGGLGVGAVESGMAAYSIGTVECITPAFSSCVLNETMQTSNFATYPHVVDNLYTTVAFNMTGGSGLKWFRDTLGQYEKYQAEKSGSNAYDILLKEMPQKPTNLLVLPHFTTTGTPYFDANPTSAILGIELTTTKGEMVKGLLEGITFEMKLNLELLKKSGIAVNQLKALGGGTKSDAWMQIKADIFEIPIEVMQVSEAGCLGAALLAAKACGQITELKDCARQWCKPYKCFEPDLERAKIYKEKFGIYFQLYEKIKSLSLGLKKVDQTGLRSQ
jgi:xylulokinase